jgi:hypothetical protein
MEESLKIMNMHLSMINKAYITLLQPLKPPSRMKLWKGKIGVYNKWSELSYFLVKAVNTTSYVLNRVYNRYIKKTPHEL